MVEVIELRMLLVSLLWDVAGSVSIFYTTNHLQFDCLHYPLSDSYIPELLQYCYSPINDIDSEIGDFLNKYERYFSFAELQRLNVTAYELLSWSASIDLAEQYQYYIDQRDNLLVSNKIFFNCTQPWFGTRCQYSLESIDSFSFVNVDSIDSSIVHHTCYILLECDRGSSSMCLDWREVCNGRIDCLNGGIDERQCFDLEMNECDESEYRCHNGLCISQVFWKEEHDTAECLDQSDLPYIFECPISFFQLGIFDMFVCEEYSCRPGEQQFSCGDGQCVEDFDECQNGRHLLLAESMSVQGSLSYDCRMAMTCLSKIIDQVDGISCEHFFENYPIIVYLQTCEEFTVFPTMPVLFGHVRFLYRPKNITEVNITIALIPDYVCYDEQLCDFLVPTFRHEMYACRHGYEMGFQPNVQHHSWKSLIDSVKPYVRGCLTGHHNGNYSQHPSLYACNDSSKYISNYRIVDGTSDCYLNDDEEAFELSCLLNDIQRFRCPDETKCRSLLLYNDISLNNMCPTASKRHLNEILFHEICDRAVDLLPVTIDGRNHTDETDCEYWQCSNIYTRCDGFWNCLNGEDEENCARSICPSKFLPCVSIENFSLICLPAEQVGNGIIDCFAASDEPQYCRISHLYNGVSYQFRCQNDTGCVQFSDLCNSNPNCPLRDDEEFCANQSGLCHERAIKNFTDVQDVLCRVGAIRRDPFLMATVEIYPPLENRMIDSIMVWPVEQHGDDAEGIETYSDDSPWSAHCNRGVLVYLRFGSHNNSYRCFCPPNYYGDRCQYQNQRVSLTLVLTTVEQDGVYAIVITLIDESDDRQEINSYYQAIYVPSLSCRKPINTYLLYSTRPKNSSKNYSVRVDAFDKISLTYLGSWHLNIPFLFLPVNRLAAALSLPTYQSSNLNQCVFPCHKGTCTKYINKERFFCKCFTGWSGAQCNIPVHCSDCSPDSICFGSIGNRSICVCPLEKFCPRCFLKYSCPINYCKHSGRCIVLDQRMIAESYVCLCSKPFHGTRCELTKAQLQIGFYNMTIPSYLFAIFFDAVVSQQPISRYVELQKLTMFQLKATFYFLIPFRIILIMVDNNYYLAVFQHANVPKISTSIGPDRRCFPIDELLHFSQLTLPQIQRVKSYHNLCQINLDLKCFFDETFMCLCTLEHHANCFHFHYRNNFSCEYDIHCQNGGTCLQDMFSVCPSNTICVCTDCFFGDRCQFYAKGIGLILDDMLRYAIRPKINFNDQSYLVKVGAAFTMIMFVGGLVNSILTFLTFLSQDSRQVGCGMYLFALSMTSTLTVSMLTIKFWFIVITHINLLISRPVLHAGCVVVESVLKVCLYMDNWLNASVAVERATTVFKGVSFNKAKSKHVARWTIPLIAFFITCTITYESMHRNLVDDYEEQRVWCVTHYSQSVHNYNTAIILFHFLVPFGANLSSALFIIFTLARQRSTVLNRQNYKKHLRKQFNKHKQLIISPMILVLLSIPRLIISFFSGCVKESRNSWLYISGYFISFIPSASVFIVFVLPSKTYRNQLKKLVKNWQQRFNRR